MLRWHAWHDLDLLREVVAVRPTNTIAANLQHEEKVTHSQRSPVKGRSFKEHFDVLLAHHRVEMLQH